MIVKFNPKVFNATDDPSLSAIFEVFFSFINDSFLWDAENLAELFISEEGEFVFDNDFRANYLAPNHVEKLIDKINEAFLRAAYNTQTHQKYIRHITIGDGTGEISPSDALLLISKPSHIIVENSHNDGRFVEGLIMNYVGFGKRGSIYTLINEALKKRRLRFSHAGGGGSLKTITEDLNINEFAGRGNLKMIVLFDSDRENRQTINLKYNNLLRFLKGRDFNPANNDEWVYQLQDTYLWHMTYKREMENYAPLDLMYQTYNEITTNLQQQLNTGTNDFRDFYDFSKILNDGFKNITPGIFLSKHLVKPLENKCRHHLVKIELHNGTLEDVSEIEDILLKIAQLI